MSNNDLWCSVCRSHHHPVECPMDDVEAQEIPQLKKLMKEPSVYDYDWENAIKVTPNRWKKDIVKLTAPLLNRLVFFGLGVLFGFFVGTVVGLDK